MINEILQNVLFKSILQLEYCSSLKQNCQRKVHTLFHFKFFINNLSTNNFSRKIPNSVWVSVVIQQTIIFSMDFQYFFWIHFTSRAYQTNIKNTSRPVYIRRKLFLVAFMNAKHNVEKTVNSNEIGEFPNRNVKIVIEISGAMSVI